MVLFAGVAALVSLSAGCREERIDAVPIPGQGGAGVSRLGGIGGATQCGAQMSGGGPVGGARGAIVNGSSEAAPFGGTVVSAAVPPPAISGGTLIVLGDGVTAVASDPDRDSVYVVDIPSAKLAATVKLNPHDEPGRLVEDGTGLVHVALRGGGAIATIDPHAGTLKMRRSACLLPRGIAYDAAQDVLYLACASGTLLTFAPTGAAPTATWTLQPDLRDVIVDGPRLLVTRFHTAEVLVVDGGGQTSEVIRPATFSDPSIQAGASFEPAVAWRAVPMPGGGAMMVHQRGMKGTVAPSPGGYGRTACDTIVHTCVSKMKRGMAPLAGAAIPGFALPVDIAVSSDAQYVALIAAGNGQGRPGSSPRMWVTDVNQATSPRWTNGCAVVNSLPSCSPVPGTAGSSGNAGGSGTVPGSACKADLAAPGEPIAVAFAAPTVVLVQTREPAQIAIIRDVVSNSPTETSVLLSSESRTDTGHALFHANSGAGLACASCHPEGHEDGRTWDFACEGPRRTQDPSGGLVGTEPFHWNGEMKDFSTLVSNVFTLRMSGPNLAPDHVGALQRWVDSIPTLPALRAATDAQVMRGQSIFQSSAVGCAACHAGAAFTNNATTSVGTIGTFQVPSLRGVGWRAPYMHDGCAGTLASRFSDVTCGGGDAHGVTSNLAPSDLDDLIAYLQSL